MLYSKVYEEAERAIEEHKWLESEKAGRDLGIDAKRDWIEHYWRGFYRSCFVQHLRGEVYFDEFQDESFGIFSKQVGDLTWLLNLVLERIKEGAENLDLILWGSHERVPFNQLLKVLVAVDINRHRLLPPH